MQNLLKNLNPEQKEAVTHIEGPLLIVAGAGTGKTTVIARRIAYLIENGLAKSDEILALTFTEKAAGEMEERVEQLLPMGYLDLWISTFHGFAERILKDNCLDIGLPGDFKLLNEFEQWALIRKNLDRFDLDYYRPLGNPTKFIHALIKHFSRAKDENISPADYLAYAEELKENGDAMLANTRTNMTDMTNNIEAQEVGRINEVANAYHIYQQLLLENSVLDFGDLINYCLKLFRDRPAILEKYRKQFKYILLDEFQDTNWSQYELVKILTAPLNNLVVVGDDDQSVYAFRGASMSNILHFKKDYPESREIVLKNNYRNRQNILDLAYRFIQLNNPNRLEYRLGCESGIRNQKRAAVLCGETAAGQRETAAGQKYRLNRELGIRNQESENGRNLMSENQAAVVAQTRHSPLQETAAGPESGELKQNAKAKLNPDIGHPMSGFKGANALNKKLIAQTAGEGKIGVIQAGDLYGEVENVINKIIELKNNDDEATWNDFAILTRANDSAKDFCAALDKADLPYIFYSSRGLYAKPVVMDAIAYLKMLDNYHESPALFRVLNLPIFGFTHQELVNFNYWARRKAWSLYEAVRSAGALQISGVTLKKAENILSLIEKHTALAKRKSSGEILAAFFNDSGYMQFLTKQEERICKESMDCLNQFLKRIKTFEAASGDKTIKAFLAELELEMEAGEQGGLAPDLDAGPEAIKVMTIHAAKGLEFQYVFVANMVDKRFPTLERKEQIAIPDALIKEILPGGDAHLEEERRLFYVAVTRAKQGLYFSWAEDYGGARKKKPSRFLGECGMDKLDNKSDRTAGTDMARTDKTDRTNTTIPPTPLAKGGDMLKHFSYTQLAAFSNCPYQYRFAHILKVPIQGKAVFSFGKTMHMVLQKIFLLVNERQGFGQGNLFETEDDKTNKTDRTNIIGLEEILKIYEQSWIDDWYEDKNEKEKYRAKGKEILKVFYEKYKNDWPRAVFLEKGFNVKLSDGKEYYTVRGVIDRIDEEGGKLKIVDYKTGQPKDKLKFEEKEQLLIYQLAIRDLFEKEIASLAFYYLNDNSEAEFLGTKEELEKVKRKILNIISEIKKGEFPAKPSVLCVYCDFKGICEFRKM